MLLADNYQVRVRVTRVRAGIAVRRDVTREVKVRVMPIRVRVISFVRPCSAGYRL